MPFITPSRSAFLASWPCTGVLALLDEAAAVHTHDCSSQPKRIARVGPMLVSTCSESCTNALLTC